MPSSLERSSSFARLLYVDDRSGPFPQAAGTDDSGHDHLIRGFLCSGNQGIRRKLSSGGRQALAEGAEHTYPDGLSCVASERRRWQRAVGVRVDNYVFASETMQFLGPHKRFPRFECSVTAVSGTQAIPALWFSGADKTDKTWIEIIQRHDGDGLRAYGLRRHGQQDFSGHSALLLVDEPMTDEIRASVRIELKNALNRW
jgi:hypothetical protein